MRDSQSSVAPRDHGVSQKKTYGWKALVLLFRLHVTFYVLYSSLPIVLCSFLSRYPKTPLIPDPPCSMLLRVVNASAALKSNPPSTYPLDTPTIGTLTVRYTLRMPTYSGACEQEIYQQRVRK
jgi:hypothetical protein